MHVVSFTITKLCKQNINPVLYNSHHWSLPGIYSSETNKAQLAESFHPELSWVLNQKDLPGSEEGRDESNGGNLCFLFLFFSCLGDAREGDGQQQRGWTIKGDWIKVKWKVKGKWRLRAKQWTSLAFTVQSQQTAAGKVPVSPSCSMEAAGSQLMGSDGFCPGLTCAMSWSIVWGGHVHIWIPTERGCPFLIWLDQMYICRDALY